MYGEPLCADVINISEYTKEKMLSYFKVMQEEGCAARGIIPSLPVLPTEELDELLSLKLMSTMKSFWNE